MTKLDLHKRSVVAANGRDGKSNVKKRAGTIAVFLMLIYINTRVFAVDLPTSHNSPVFLREDRWCAIGDSITHQGRYLGTIYLYYLTRYPQDRFQLFNCGCGGDTTVGTLRRMDEDIFVHKPTVATVMLGMNDIWWENTRRFKPDTYKDQLARIVDRLQKQHCRVILCTSSPYDFSVKNGNAIDANRHGLDRYVQETRELAAQRGVPLVDFYKTMTQITAEEQTKDPDFSLAGPDRTHPGPLGGFIMGYVFLKALNAQAMVSKMVVDADAGKCIECENCVPGKVTVNENEVSFSYLEKALPFPVAAVPQESANLVPFIKDFDQEILQVKGLESDQYELMIDDVKIGIFPASELSRGLNLAAIAVTPQNQQAKLLMDLDENRTSIDRDDLRYIAMIEYGELKNHYAVDDVKTPTADIEKKAGTINHKFDHYLSLKSKQSSFIKEAKTYDDKLWQNAIPVWHHYRLKPMNSIQH